MEGKSKSPPEMAFILLEFKMSSTWDAEGNLKAPKEIEVILLKDKSMITEVEERK